MEDKQEEFVNILKEQVVNECRDQLLKQMFLMTHENGYPSEAVPKATILSLPKLMKVSPRPSEEYKLLKAIKWCDIQIKAASENELSILRQIKIYLQLLKC